MTNRLAFRQDPSGAYTATACGVTYRVIGISRFRAYRVTADDGLHPAAEGGEHHSRASAYAQCETDLEQVLADREPAAEPGPVTDDDLAAVPLEYRRTVARWLTERAASIQPSIFVTDHEAGLIRACLQGAAVYLMSPGVDDSTIGHAQAVLGGLALPDPRACDRHRTDGGHVPSCRWCREGVAGPSLDPQT